VKVPFEAIITLTNWHRDVSAMAARLPKLITACTCAAFDPKDSDTGLVPPRCVRCEAEAILGEGALALQALREMCVSERAVP
jgi:hypothetical protein